MTNNKMSPKMGYLMLVAFTGAAIVMMATVAILPDQMALAKGGTAGHGGAGKSIAGSKSSSAGGGGGGRAVAAVPRVAVAVAAVAAVPQHVHQPTVVQKDGRVQLQAAWRKRWQWWNNW